MPWEGMWELEWRMTHRRRPFTPAPMSSAPFPPGWNSLTVTQASLRSQLEARESLGSG